MVAARFNRGVRSEVVRFLALPYSSRASWNVVQAGGESAVDVCIGRVTKLRLLVVGHGRIVLWETRL